MSFRCFDRIPDDAAQDIFDREGGPPEEAAAISKCFWRVGSVLRVRFLDGPAALRQQVMEAAADWTARGNLTLAVVEHGPAEIRVTFASEGNWSALGTQALSTQMFRAEEPTMCLGEAPGAPATRVAQLARHEFGHAIGLVHEHSSPSAGIRWNKPVVYRELGGPPNCWPQATVDYHVFLRYDRNQTQFTQFDPKSVMVYAFPPHWTLDGFTIAENAELSEADLAFVGRIYPGRPD